MKGSVTRLIYKKRGDIKNLKNWRPISLLNADYKIISKALTSSLAKVLEFIVTPDQTCSVPGRSIFSNVTLLRDIIDSIQETLRSEWRSLASNLIPNAVLPSNFYSDCISVLSSVRLADDNLNSKVFYNLLLSKESSSPLLSWHWTPVLGPGFFLSKHWSRVRDDFCENFKEDILWLIVLRGIKVRDSLTHWGYIANPQCSFCGKRETIDHCFLYCSRVKCV